MTDDFLDRLADDTVSGLKGFFVHRINNGDDPTTCMQMFLDFLESNKEKNPQFFKKIASKIDSSFFAPLAKVNQIASPDDFIATYHNLVNKLIGINPVMPYKADYERQKALIESAKNAIRERIVAEKEEKTRIVDDEYNRILSERKEEYKKAGGGKSLRKTIIASSVISICLLVPLLLNILIPPSVAKEKGVSSQDPPAFAPLPLWGTSVHFGLDQIEAASAMIGDKRIIIWDLITEDVVTTLTGHTESVDRTAFSPDGERLASAASDGTIFIWDLATGEVEKSLKVHNRASNDPLFFSPDGTKLASGAYDGTVVWDLASGEELLTIPTTYPWSPSFSPDGTKLAAGAGDTIIIWDLASGEAETTLDGHTGELIRSTAFSPDGTRLASGAGDGTIIIWALEPGEVERRLVVRRTTGAFLLSFGPDGTQLAAAPGSQIMLWNLTTGKARIVARGNGAVVASLLFSPDGTQLASTSFGQDVVIWDLLQTELFIPFLPYQVFYVVLLFGAVGIVSAVIYRSRVSAIQLTSDEASACNTSLDNIEKHFSDKEKNDIAQSTVKILTMDGE